MLQIIVSVLSRQNGSMNAVSGTGMTSMSDSLMACQPRMLEPSKPRPSSNTPSSRASAGMVHETEIDRADFLFADQSQDFFGCHDLASQLRRLPRQHRRGAGRPDHA